MSQPIFDYTQCKKHPFKPLVVSPAELADVKNNWTRLQNHLMAEESTAKRRYDKVCAKREEVRLALIQEFQDSWWMQGTKEAVQAQMKAVDDVMIKALNEKIDISSLLKWVMVERQVCDAFCEFMEKKYAEIQTIIDNCPKDRLAYWS